MAYGQMGGGWMQQPWGMGGGFQQPDWLRSMGGTGGYGFNPQYGQGGQPPPWSMAQPLGAGPERRERISQGGSQGNPYTWEDLSYVAQPQFLGYYLRDAANKLGYFGDPRQSAMFDFSRQQAAQNSGAMQRRAQMMGQVAGLPQGQRGYAYLQGQLGGQGSEAAINNQLLRQQFEQQQDYFRQLAAGFANIPDTRAQTRAMRQSWMGPAASVLGAGLGAFRLDNGAPVAGG